MKNCLFFYLILFLYGSSTPTNEINTEKACKHDRAAFYCVKLLRVHDGDTFSVDIPNVHPLIGENVSVRIRGIDTPELNGKGQCEKKYALEAKILVESILKHARRIDLKNLGRDKYFRIVADVEVDNVNSIKSMLIQNHLAYEYNGTRKPRINWCIFKKKGTVPNQPRSLQKKVDKRG